MSFFSFMRGKYKIIDEINNYIIKFWIINFYLPWFIGNNISNSSKCKPSPPYSLNKVGITLCFQKRCSEKNALWDSPFTQKAPPEGEANLSLSRQNSQILVKLEDRYNYTTLVNFFNKYLHLQKLQVYVW